MDHTETATIRINRAVKHLNEFMQEADRFLATSPFGTYTEKYTDNGMECLKLYYRVYQEPPKILGIIAGDCIHNLRATLDNMIWSLGKIYPTTNPKAKPDKLAFPICKTKEKYLEKINTRDFMAIQDFPQAAQDLIERLQPYHTTWSAYIISILHELWNADKHKTPELMAGAGGGVTQTYNLQQPASLSAGMYIRDGQQFGYGTIPETGIPQDAKVELLNIDLLFQENGPASGQTARWLLSHFIKVVHETICEFGNISIDGCNTNKADC